MYEKESSAPKCLNNELCKDINPKKAFTGRCNTRSLLYSQLFQNSDEDVFEGMFLQTRQKLRKANKTSLNCI